MIFYIGSIFIHWLCDFVLQEGDLARESESDYKLWHVLYYSFTFPVCTWFMWLVGLDSSFLNFAMYSLICVAAHGIVDYMLIPVLYHFKANLKMLGLAWALDQVIHIAIILIALEMLLL